MSHNTWPQIARSARGVLGLTQEAFAEALNTTQETVSRWEKGRMTPSVAMQRKLLDILNGHFSIHPQFLAIKAMVRATGIFQTLYTPGMIANTVSGSLRDLLERNRMEIIGTSILPKVSGLLGEVTERWSLPMLEGKTEVLSVSFTDRGLADRSLILRRTLSVIPTDAVRVLIASETIIGVSDDDEAPAPDLQLITSDDVKD